jgi:hypothetical protein
MKKSSHISNAKTNSEVSQSVTDQANHTFQWSRGTATCSAGGWTLWGASLESAKRSHALHRANLPEAQRVSGGPDEIGLSVRKTTYSKSKG